MLIALLIRGVTLEGYLEGIKFYIIPKWDKILNIKVSCLEISFFFFFDYFNL